MVESMENFIKLSCLVACAGLVAGCGQSVSNNEGDVSVSESDSSSPVVVTELIVKEIAPGDGPVAEAGQTAVMHYTGWIYEPASPDLRGSKFDSSRDRNDPFLFKLGAGQVISGWDNGIPGMRVGGKRELIIPPDMAYGSRGAGGVIPPDATLLFDVELLELR